MFNISNVRIGFATNSSSTHSICFRQSNQPLPKEREHEIGSYGWEEFVLSTTNSKVLYGITLLHDTIISIHGSDVAMYYTKGKFKEELSDDELQSIIEGCGIDHQSFWTLPTINNYGQFSINYEYYDAFMDFLKSDISVIGGGNDNDGDDPLEGDYTQLELPREQDNKEWKAKCDGDFWILFNRRNGHKTRFSFTNPTTEYTKSIVPELVDIKITDFCETNCAFCLTGDAAIDTINGPIQIKDIQVDDVVLTYNFEYQMTEYHKVNQTFKREYVGEIITIELENDIVIQLTPNHEVFTTNRGWILAGDLEETDDVQGLSHKLRIKSIKKSMFDGYVYNFGTSPNHNYFANGVLVHNCYQGSTPQGKHGDKDFIEATINSLGRQGVFEIAFGGGETTSHPQFTNFLQICKYNDIIPNFTTRNLEWLRNLEWTKYYDMIGGFAYSTESVEDIKRFAKLLNDVGAQNIPYVRSKANVQVVMGTMTRANFKKALIVCKENHLNITLLGYKTTGRGDEFTPKNYDWWIDVIAELKTTYQLPNVGIDTALANQYQQQIIDAGIPKWLFQVKEGKFSCYIDAVECKMGPSSFCDVNQMHQFTPSDCKWSKWREDELMTQMNDIYQQF